VRVLITNDDGVDTIGIRTLARAAVDKGLQVIVAAPHQERSGSSAALSALEQDGRLVVENRSLDGLDGVAALAVHATPALIVFTAVRGAFGEPPDLVLSGINHGPNTGMAVLHSGTVGAALTACAHGLPALAVSLAAESPAHWETAMQATTRALGWFMDHASEPYVLNVNVPDIPPEQLRGLRQGRLASFGAVQAKVGERNRGYVTVTFEEIDQEPPPDTDVALLRNGWASATALQPPGICDAIDLTTVD
jgi:5'-nucleotidase